MKILYRHILGYTFGLAIFLILIPYSLYKLSWLDIKFFDFVLFKSDLLRIIIFLPVFVVGIVFAIWSNIFLLKVGEGGPAEGFGVAISPKTKNLVTSGPYRYSRNPMVFGAFTLYFSIAIFLNSMICILTLLFFIFVVRFYLKYSEEKRLVNDFGQEYIEYRKRVPMIFPFIGLK